MGIEKFTFRPGINREQNDLSGEGGWYDGDKIRFSTGGKPEKIGGWTEKGSGLYQGVGRLIFSHVTLTGLLLNVIGTHLKLYLEEGGSFNDITPLRATASLGADPITTGDAGSGIVTVSHSSHGATIDDFVTISGADAVDGITADELNTEHQIIEVIDGNSYKIDTGGSASSGSSNGGGAAVSAAYQINSGLNSTVYGTGWGAGTWGRGTWGSSASATAKGASLRLWFADSYGEDVIANIRDGAVYYWDATGGPSARAVELSSLSGADGTPTVAVKILVSDESRHVIAFGCNPIGESDQDPMLIRWADEESLIDWVPTDTNSAGDRRLASGSRIITALKTRGEILVFTDKSLHSMRYVGGEFIFGTFRSSGTVTLAGPNAAVAVDDSVYWMGSNGFYKYEGRVVPIPCTVRDYVFENINRDQFDKVFAGVNNQHNEVIWFYPSANSNENDRYVIFNHLNNIWYFGNLVRTAWIDVGIFQFPMALTPDVKKVYFHEYGNDNGEENPPAAINAFIESSQFDLDAGHRFMFVDAFLPDISMIGSDATAQSMKFDFKFRKASGAALAKTVSKTITRTAVDPEQYTSRSSIRGRGRTMAVRVYSDETGVKWRCGDLRLSIRPDGRRA